MNNPIRILLVNDFNPYSGGGGTETYLKQLLRGLGENQRFKVDLFFGQDFNFSRLSGLYSKKYLNSLANKIKLFRPDIVHFHMVTQVLSPSVISAVKKTGVKTVLTVHSFNCVCNRTWGILASGAACPDWFSWQCLGRYCPSSRRRWQNICLNYLRWPFIYYYRRQISRSIDALICPSQFLAQALKKSLKLNPQVIRYFINPVNLNWGAVKNEILYIGRLSAEKGIELLIRALAQVKAKIPAARLKIVGTGNRAYQNRLRRLVKELSLEQCVAFIDFTDLPWPHYQKANLVVIPSLCLENSPLVVYEAFSAGVPVVASRAGGLIELVQDSQAGVLFQQGDVEDLAEKIIQVLTQPSRQETMHRLGREYFQRTLNKENNLVKLTAVYEQLSGES